MESYHNCHKVWEQVCYEYTSTLGVLPKSYMWSSVHLDDIIFVCGFLNTLIRMWFMCMYDYREILHG